VTTIQAAQAFAVNDLVRVLGDQPHELPWRITEIVTDEPEHDGPFARLVNTDGDRSWSALRILLPYAPCPPGCAGHLGGGAHISVEQVFLATAYDGEHRQVYVSRERCDRNGAPVVRIQDAGDAAMRPDEALQFGLAIVAEAIAAQTTWQMTR
jgi:hypothetical protein